MALFVDQTSTLHRDIDGLAEQPHRLLPALHRLKGSARALGAFALADLAAELEQQVRNDSPPWNVQTDDSLRWFKAALAQARDFAAHLLSED